MDFPTQQAAALQSVQGWLQGGTEQVFRLFGYAGTGKTTLARHLAEGVDGPVFFAAYTGKAAHVLRSKGCVGATTIHKLIYLPRFKSKARLDALEDRLTQMDPADPARPKLLKEVEAERENMRRPAFNLNLDSDLNGAKLLVVDEVSMVDEQTARDLESFGCKILVLGDPAQLPPVRGTGHYTEAQPDFMLTDIHRQAKDNPILSLATQLRNKEMPAVGRYGDSSVRGKMDASDALTVEQMIVGKNETRHAFNARVRGLKGFEGTDPVAGDKVVCRHNSRAYSFLMNGTLAQVRESRVLTEDRLMVGITADGQDVTVQAHRQPFTGGKPPWYETNEAEELHYGYALTAHNAQGSQWDSVLVYDESGVFRQDRWRWLYTAVTRAARRVDLIRRQ